MRALWLTTFLVAVEAAAGKPSDFAHAVDDLPEALRVIRQADEIYVMPVWVTEKRRRAEISGTYTVVIPHGDDRHARRLGPDESQRLRRILGKYSSWFHGN